MSAPQQPVFNQPAGQGKSRMVAGLLNFFLGGIASKCPEAVAAVISSAGYVAVCWLFLYFLYRKNVFLKV